MCNSSHQVINTCSIRYSGCKNTWPLKRSSLRLHRRHNRKRSKLSREAKEKEMEIKNIKLYMENKTILEENEKLRNKALLLHKENQLLFSHLQNLSLQNKQQYHPLSLQTA